MPSFEYDAEAKALYVRVSDLPPIRGEAVRTEELIPDLVNVDYDADGLIIGIEILDVRASGGDVDG